MGILISLNVKSFMHNLLASLKRILSEASLLKTSHNTNILVFTFVSFIADLQFKIVARYLLFAVHTSTKHESASRQERTVLEHAG